MPSSVQQLCTCPHACTAPKQRMQAHSTLLQGIRAADRSRLLALCLAALEAQVAALPPGAGLSRAGAMQWRQLASTLLALSSVAAAAAWLGYVPGSLLQAAAKQLAAADQTVLQAAGLQAAAVALQRQAAAAASGSSRDSEEEEEEDGSSAVAWYCLEEKLQVYSSVLRLLSCSTIEQQQERRQQEAAALGLPLASTASSDGDDALAAAGGSGSGGAVARQQALALLQQRHAEGEPPGAVRCGRCLQRTLRNCCSGSLLLWFLSVANSVLHRGMLPGSTQPARRPTGAHPCTRAPPAGCAGAGVRLRQAPAQRRSCSLWRLLCCKTWQ